ncbi:hypothetical protein BJY01DRAFT_256571 [Aspergillus pseudoustus]|uniref:Uncharacterized protein n=1 Tax=Aspergillus pseudoustus TaxID=1810923 RepID=A0ABR4I7X5_9EURO
MTQDTPPTGSATRINISLNTSTLQARYHTHLPPPPPPIDPSSLPEPEQRIYTCLRTQDWTPEQCDFYFADIPRRQRHVHLILRLLGWNEEQLGRFDQRCAAEYLPEGLPPPDPEDDNIPVPNFWVNHRLLEDGNLRRARISTRMLEEMNEAERVGIEERRRVYPPSSPHRPTQ